MVGGIASLIQLPVREYPAVDRPVVSISTVYRGASNEVIESRVTEIIEGAVAGIEGIRQISSQSQNDRSSVSVEFDVSRNRRPPPPTCATRSPASPAACPTGPKRPWCGRSTPTPRPSCGSASPRRASIPRAQRLPEARLRGPALDRPGRRQRLSRRRAALRHAHLGRSPGAGRPRLTVQDVDTAIRRQNVELPGGRIESAQREFTVKTDSRLSTPESSSR